MQKEIYRVSEVWENSFSVEKLHTQKIVSGYFFNKKITFVKYWITEKSYFESKYDAEQHIENLAKYPIHYEPYKLKTNYE